jgi:acetyl esterase/lipase
MRAVVLVFLAVCAFGQQPLPAPQTEIALYEGTAPGSEKWTWSERTVASGNGAAMVQNVVRPVLMYYPAPKEKAVGTAMIVAPGGGFRNLMMTYEGVDVAKRMNELGIDAFVLKYRLTYTGTDLKEPQAGQNVRQLAAADGMRAVQLVRQHAADHGYKADRIGMIGYSAGGAVVLAAAAGPAESRPNFTAAIYAADAGKTQPPSGATPMFIAVAADDQSVGWQGSVDLFTAWRKANVPVELHVFQTGRHGFGKKGGGADHYLDRLEEWMRVNGWLTR